MVDSGAFEKLGSDRLVEWKYDVYLSLGYPRESLQQKGAGCSHATTAPCSNDLWGTRHELRKWKRGETQYVGNKRYYASDMKRGSSLIYLGQTELLEFELRNLGTSASNLANIPGTQLIPDMKYHFLNNNCQLWVQRFLAQICPLACTMDGLADRFSSWSCRSVQVETMTRKHLQGSEFL